MKLLSNVARLLTADRAAITIYREMTTLELSDEEAVALIRLLREAIDGDRCQFSPRVQTLKGILNKLKPEPARPAASREIFASPTRGYIQEGAVDVDILPVLDDTKGGLESLTVSDPAHRDFSLW